MNKTLLRNKKECRYRRNADIDDADIDDADKDEFKRT